VTTRIPIPAVVDVVIAVLQSATTVARSALLARADKAKMENTTVEVR
jgi:hypothetical protein